MDGVWALVIHLGTDGDLQLITTVTPYNRNSKMSISYLKCLMIFYKYCMLEDIQTVLLIICFFEVVLKYKPRKFKKETSYFFNILLTVHIGTILANNQLDALPLMYLFILLLYMFRKAQCSSSGDRLY
jgi:hypothetical protein